jgi:hypothetical protein
LARRICCERFESCFCGLPWENSVAATAAKYWITFLVFSVLPAPDSPLCTQSQRIQNDSEGWMTYVTRMLWLVPSSTRLRKARSAMAKMCGLVSSRLWPLYILMYSLVYMGNGQYGLTVTRNRPE